MTPKKSKNLPVAPASASYWDGGLSLLACLVVVLVPFFPDEKLVRLKMQALEYGVFALVAVIGLRLFLTSSLPFEWKKSPAWTLTAVVTGWVGVQILLWFLSAEKSLASNELRRVFLGAGAFFAFGLMALKNDCQKRIVVVWAIAAGLIATYGFMQVSGGIAMIQVPKMDRVMGTFGNPIFFAAYLACSFFVTLAALSVQRKAVMKSILFLSLVLQATALYYTQTRGAWLGFAAALLYGLIYKLRTRAFPKWIFLVVIAVGGLFAYRTRRVWHRDQGHLLIWRDTLRMWHDHSITGVGLGAFHVVFPSYAQDDLKSKWPQGQFIVNYAHNEYLQDLAEGGVIGFGSFLAILIVFYRFVHRREDPYLLFLAMGVTSLLVQNMFSVDMRFGISLGLFFALIGIVTVSAVPDAEKWVATAPWPIALRVPGVVLWATFLGLIIFPRVIEPYRAQKIVAETPGFFNERLLDPAKSIQDLETLAQQYPNEPAVLEKLAYVYAKEMKTVDEKINMARANAAIGTYEKLIALSPNNLRAINNLANIHYTMGHSDEAIRMWKRAVEVDPDFLDAHSNLGKTLYVRGNLKESAAHFEKVLKLNPGNPEAIVYLKKMVE